MYNLYKYVFIYVKTLRCEDLLVIALLPVLAWLKQKIPDTSEALI